MPSKNIKWSYAWLVYFGKVMCLAGLAGCSTEGPTTGGHISSPLAPNATVKYDTVAINDAALQRFNGLWSNGSLAVENQGCQRTEVGTVRAFATFRNRTERPIEITCRTTFYDQYFVEVESPSSERRVFIGPNGLEGYEELSLSASRVAHYRIEVGVGK